jgi:hypothetical protein
MREGIPKPDLSIGRLMRSFGMTEGFLMIEKMTDLTNSSK